MSEFRNTLQLFQDFKILFDQKSAPLDKCKDLMTKLKVETTKLSLSGSHLSPEQEKQQLILIREILEYGALLSIQLHDISSFERYVAQVKTYYYDYVNKLPASQRQYMILGLNLLHLLAKNKLDEFHTELELIPLEIISRDVFIKHPVQLEQYMMEGAYNEVLKARDSVPAQSYTYFMDLFMETVRNEIADCIVKAYSHLNIQDAQKLLGFSSEDQLREYAKNRSWQVGKANHREILTFAKKEDVSKEKADIPAMKLIQQQLHYARELERII